MVVDVPVTVAGGQPTPGEVAAMVSATMLGKRKRAVYQPQAEVGAAPAVAAAAVTPAPPKMGRSKTKSAGPRGNPPSKAKAANRVGLAPPPPKAAVPPPFIPPPPPQAVNDAHNVFGDSSTTEFLSALNDSSVDVADGIPPFDEEIGDEEYDEEIGDEEERGYVASSNALSDDRDIWRIIWKSQVPEKVHIFAWRAVQNALATEMNKRKRNMDVTGVCTVCGLESKDMAHMCFRCPHDVAFWQAMREV
ncbi:hypothetical protein ACQ4PT_000996 [Festuca glaucescens]